MENVLCFKLLLSKKQEDKNLFGGTLCINLVINANVGPKNVDRVNGIYKNENDWAFLAKVGPKYTENTAVNVVRWIWILTAFFVIYMYFSIFVLAVQNFRLFIVLN